MHVFYAMLRMYGFHSVQCLHWPLILNESYQKARFVLGSKASDSKGSARQKACFVLGLPSHSVSYLGIGFCLISLGFVGWSSPSSPMPPSFSLRLGRDCSSPHIRPLRPFHPLQVTSMPHDPSRGVSALVEPVASGPVEPVIPLIHASRCGLAHHGFAFPLPPVESLLPLPASVQFFRPPRFPLAMCGPSSISPSSFHVVLSQSPPIPPQAAAPCPIVFIFNTYSLPTLSL